MISLPSKNGPTNFIKILINVPADVIYVFNYIHEHIHLLYVYDLHFFLYAVHDCSYKGYYYSLLYMKIIRYETIFFHFSLEINYQN